MYILSKMLSFFKLAELRVAIRSLNHIQLNIVDCGFSVASYAIDRVQGVNLTPEYLKNSNKAISLADIKTILEEFNIEAVGVRNSALKFQTNSIYIVQVNNEHFIAIEVTHNNKILLFDPVCGQYQEEHENLTSLDISKIMLKITCDQQSSRRVKKTRTLVTSKAEDFDLALTKIKSISG